MDSKRWLACFLATVLLLGAAVVGFNYWVDPFGVFSHKSLEWPSYEMTINPRTAKITYLKDHHQDYDSYILGCSSTSSFPVESLNSYLDASFYNMIMYGADMLDVEERRSTWWRTMKSKIWWSTSIWTTRKTTTPSQTLCPTPCPRRPQGKTPARFCPNTSLWTPATVWTS